MLHGPGTLREALHLPGGPPLEFEVAPAAFFQPNTLQAEVLYDQVLRAAGLEGPVAHAFDLYCGTGTIGLALARVAARVTGVELNAAAVANAERNAVDNGLSDKPTFIAGDVGEVHAVPVER